MKVYLAPDVVLSYIIGNSKKVDELFQKIGNGDMDAVVSTLTWYEVVGCLQQVDDVNYVRMADVIYTCEIMLYPEGKSLQDIEFPKIPQDRIDSIRNISFKYSDSQKDIIGPDLKCWICRKDLIEPKTPGGVWLCPDKKCDSHMGDEL